VAKNPAIPLAFATLLNKKIIIPAGPELMGCFGVAILALEKIGNSLTFDHYDLDELINRDMKVVREFKCHACENLCPIKIIQAGGHSYNFGGRCNKYSNKALNSLSHKNAIDYINIRKDMLFQEFAGTINHPNAPTIAVPETFSIYTLWPFYSNFLNSLGFNLKIYSTPALNPSLKCESSFCYPGELAHGIMENLLHGQFDYIFLPHYKAMPSYQSDIHACICPITQALPYYLAKAFDLTGIKVLSPVVDADLGLEEGLSNFVDLAISLGKTKQEGELALKLALSKQRAFYNKG
jgi:hypothetical protein